jgi:transposase, IS5 family
MLCTSGQKRRLTAQIKREFKRRAVIGHLKGHYRLGRNYLAHVSGDATPCARRRSCCTH